MICFYENGGLESLNQIFLISSFTDPCHVKAASSMKNGSNKYSGSTTLLCPVAILFLQVSSFGLSLLLKLVVQLLLVPMYGPSWQQSKQLYLLQQNASFHFLTATGNFYAVPHVGVINIISLLSILFAAVLGLLRFTLLNPYS